MVCRGCIDNPIEHSTGFRTGGMFARTYFLLILATDDERFDGTLSGMCWLVEKRLVRLSRCGLSCQCRRLFNCRSSYVFLLQTLL